MKTQIGARPCPTRTLSCSPPPTKPSSGFSLAFKATTIQPSNSVLFTHFFLDFSTPLIYKLTPSIPPLSSVLIEVPPVSPLVGRSPAAILRPCCSLCLHCPSLHFFAVSPNTHIQPHASTCGPNTLTPHLPLASGQK